MAKEIERKYLVLNGIEFLNGKVGASIVQGYLHDKGMTSRVRIVDDQQAWLTLKGPRTGISRDEYEYPLPLQDARELLEYCGDHALSKTRFEVHVGQHIWHVDVYHGALQGLVTAEVELTHEAEGFVLPSWLGPEVSEDRAYSNKKLAKAQKVPLKRVA